MERLTTTPFGRRTVSAGLMAGRALAVSDQCCPAIDKWKVFRDLTTARSTFGLPSRSLTVLSALLSFLPDTECDGDGPSIVFPSNRVLAERAHGMAEATLRRHLAALAEAGLIFRHDSPNGKRYAVRDGSGGISAAFGFDLRPLFLRARAIAEAAQACRDVARALKRKREALVLAVRDVEKLAAFVALSQAETEPLAHRIAAIKSALRRKLPIAEFDRLQEQASSLLRHLDSLATTIAVPQETSGSDARNGRHNQDQDPRILESEQRNEQPETSRERAGVGTAGVATTDLSFATVLQACPSLATYAPAPVTDWPALVRVAATLRQWLGISAETWAYALTALGPLTAATCLACILERSTEIRSPGAYLRSLALRAANGGFDPAPMVLALLHRTGPGDSAILAWVDRYRRPARPS